MTKWKSVVLVAAFSIFALCTVIQLSFDKYMGGFDSEISAKELERDASESSAKEFGRLKVSQKSSTDEITGSHKVKQALSTEVLESSENKIEEELRLSSSDVSTEAQESPEFEIEKEERLSKMMYDNSQSKSKYFVEKKVFDKKWRCMFVMGLEGTGHHMFLDFFDACKEPAANMKSGVCKFYQHVESFLYFGRSDPIGAFVYGGYNETASMIRSQQTKFKETVAALKAERYEDTLLVLNLGYGPPSNYSGKQSYPNFGGDDKSLHHPDVRKLAHLCEDAGIDLRIIVLQRNARDVLNSVTRRRFGHVGHEAAILANNVAVMSMQLQLIDPDFYQCAEYEDLKSLKGWTKQVQHTDSKTLSNFLHPRLNAESIVNGITTSTRVQKEADEKSWQLNPPKSTENSEIFFEYLETAVSRLDDLCLTAHGP